ncbi:MAG: hypothetical protein ACTSSK_04595 [Candidatus Heimdallarchaeota archaeon]
MIDNATDISLLNIAPASWTAYLPFVIGLFGIIVLFSAIVLIASWMKKRKVKPQQSNDEDSE